MPGLLVIAGPPGSGKSTVSALISAQLSPSVLVRGDAFFRFLDQGKQEPWRPEAEAQNRTVIRASGAAAGQYVRGGFEVVFDGVMGPWFWQNFCEATGLDQVHYAVLLPPVEQCLQRVHDREGHSRGEPGTRYMHQQFLRAAIEGRHLVSEAAGTPAQVAAEVLSRWEQGLLAYSSTDR